MSPRTQWRVNLKALSFRELQLFSLRKVNEPHLLRGVPRATPAFSHPMASKDRFRGGVKWDAEQGERGTSHLESLDFASFRARIFEVDCASASILTIQNKQSRALC
jgi:hypothetical protein